MWRVVPTNNKAYCNISRFKKKYYFLEKSARKMDSRFIISTQSLRCNEKANGEEERRSKHSCMNILSMSGGDGENSYSTNSLLQRVVLSMTKPVLVKNTKEMITNLNFPEHIKVADLGCSSGQNTFLAMAEIVNTINVLCQENNQTAPEIECCLNDLPDNDFNTTFKFISIFKEKLANKTQCCFVSGVPGSFYSRLFPRKSLHFIHSSYSTHYLSKVPEGLDNNKMSVYLTSSSLQSEYKAYFNQFQRDYTTFLRMRSEEMVSNGRMVLTLIGRKTVLDDPLYRDCCHWVTLLSDSLRDLFVEGLVSESKVNSFKMPYYDPNEEEMKEIIRKEGSFQINDLETHGFDLGYSNEDCSLLQPNRVTSGLKEASCIRAVTETLLLAHFGDSIDIDTLFEKYAYHVSQHATCTNKTTITLVVSLIRK